MSIELGPEFRGAQYFIPYARSALRKLSWEESLPKHRASVAICIQFLHDRPQVLLIQRSQNPHDPWSGDIALPGGRVEESDHSPLITAIRETQEEVGLGLTQGLFLGESQPFQYRKNGELVLEVRNFAFLVPSCPQLVTDPCEVEEAFWVGPEKLLERDNFQYRPFAQRTGKETTYPSVDIGRERPLWGITYQLLKNFFKILKNPD